MQKPNINTAKKVTPMIYAYTTPEVIRHDGWTKIGYTEQDVETRIKQQTHTADIQWKLEWKGNALFDDGSGESFIDKDFHAYLRKNGIEQEVGKSNEWFHVTGPVSRTMFYDFRADHGLMKSMSTVIPYDLRKEQQDAVTQTVAYKNDHENGEFLWNAKPRFGKTLSVYDFCKQIDAQTALIVTNRPAIANSWYSDYMKFLGTESGYLFVSEVDALKGKPNVLSRKDYINALTVNPNDTCKCIEFVSLQDIKGSKYFSTHGIDKLREVAEMDWDVLVIDEAHEGVDTYKTDVAFDRINRKFTLHLSGTPFKALANNKFNENAIFNWTYADEQTAKRDWDVSFEEENPYESLPKLNLFTYQMSEIIKDELQQGIEINGETEEYTFDLNEFFSTNNGKFTYDSSVDKFLDAMTLQSKFPFSTPELRDELKHTFWLLDRVDSAKAIATKLKNHPVFKDYEIILAAGDGKLDDNEETKKSYDKVVEAIAKYDKTITLSVGQLTTGITIPEWTAVLMLSNIKSPSLYMQAAFRSQNPCLFKNGSIYARKENAYVFDFDPARTLTIFEEFANDLSANTANGGGDTETRKENIKKLLNFFPVIGEDENGELIELDAEKVLTIPRKIRSAEVVRRGFMSNFLFQNISQVFGAPQSVIDIISSFDPVKESKGNVNISNDTKEDLSLNENGEVDLNDEFIVGVAQDVFGDKIYGPAEDTITNITEDMIAKPDKAISALNKLKKQIHNTMTSSIITEAKSTYGTDMKAADNRKLESIMNGAVDKMIDKTYMNYTIDKNTIEQQRTDALQNRHASGLTTAEIHQEFDKKVEVATTQFEEHLKTGIHDVVEDSKKEVVKTVETNKREREKATIENGIRDHLRGFSRTIPSFLMAYGDNTVTLATLDTIIPNNVFKEVTSITLDQFRFLRDGGSYIDPDTGEENEFKGRLFDPVVFDDSVKEFLSLKEKLADYFDEKSIEDIFDYIPPQKTNQIFTPKVTVKKMVDMLEQENPGCFDNPDKTFIDMYMKSGLYIAEIVKRLYQSEKIKNLYPDVEERLKHIFEKQVYGLAPTEIIYKIATSYILGFDKDIKIKHHNFKQIDAVPYTKEGTLQQKLDEIFGE
ncbi:MAG: DEAD/DEAH box helicase family protein [Paraclostridium sp.]